MFDFSSFSTPEFTCPTYELSGYVLMTVYLMMLFSIFCPFLCRGYANAIYLKLYHSFLYADWKSRGLCNIRRQTQPSCKRLSSLFCTSHHHSLQHTKRFGVWQMNRKKGFQVTSKTGNLYSLLSGMVVCCVTDFTISFFFFFFPLSTIWPCQLSPFDVDGRCCLHGCFRDLKSKWLL